VINSNSIAKSGSCYVQLRVDPTCHSHPHLFLLPVDPTAGSSLRSARHGAVRAPGSGAAHPCPSSRSSPSRCSGRAPLPQHPMPPARPSPRYQYSPRLGRRRAGEQLMMVAAAAVLVRQVPAASGERAAAPQKLQRRATVDSAPQQPQCCLGCRFAVSAVESSILLSPLPPAPPPPPIPCRRR
jgi:hypothetical protein